MKEIPLSLGKSALVDDEEYARLMRLAWCAAKSRHVWYAHTALYIGETRFTLRMHRYILGVWKDEIIDHRDGNGLNNTKENLRIVSNSVNTIGMVKHPRNSSGFRGVNWYPPMNRYLARITHQGKTHHLGYFEDIEEAASAYDRAALKLFGKDAPKSKIEGWVPPKKISFEELRTSIKLDFAQSNGESL